MTSCGVDAAADEELTQLRIERDHLRAAVDALSVGVAVADADLTVLLCNASCEAALGVRPTQLCAAELAAVDTAILNLDGTPMAERDWPMVLAAREGLATVEQPLLVRRGRHTRMVLCTATPMRHDGEQRPYGVLATFLDVTARREADLALEESEAHFRLLAENSTDVITRHAADGTCLYVSPALVDLLARDPSELEGLQGTSFVHATDRPLLLAGFMTVLRSGEVTTVRYRLQHLDTRWVWVETVIRPVVAEGRVLELQSSTRDVTARVETEHRLARLALTDPLTGLANRAALHQHLADLLGRGSALALLFLDLDRFKVVNDSLGHSAGDQLLRTIAARLADTCRDGDLVARLGGDEFVMVATGLDESGAVYLAERVQRSLAVPVEVAGHELVMSASIGIVVEDGSAEGDPESLLRDADVSMYEAKARGRARAVVWSPAAGQSAVARLVLERELRQALETGQLVVHYQPQVELLGGRVVGVEALVRWEHPEKGLLPPGAFLGVAEDTGQLRELGRQVLRTAAEQVAAWRRLPGHAELGLSVNVSTQELLDPGRLQATLDVLQGTGLPPSALTLEVLESVLLDAEGAVVAALAAYVRTGVRLALDDFGTGSSSLLHLRHAPVGSVKIDRAFVSGLGRSRQDEAIVRALLSLTSDLGLDCVAEGIESAEQRRWLVEQGVSVAQGYLLHRPLTAQAVGDLLRHPGGSSLRE